MVSTSDSSTRSTGRALLLIGIFLIAINPFIRESDPLFGLITSLAGLVCLFLGPYLIWKGRRRPRL
jgi:hypothetical protein